jgi:hypothetical protein
VQIQSEFLRTLTTGLRELRLLESAKKQQTRVPVVPDEDSGSDDDEYQCPKRRRKMTPRRAVYSSHGLHIQDSLQL